MRRIKHQLFLLENPHWWTEPTHRWREPIHRWTEPKHDWMDQNDWSNRSSSCPDPSSWSWTTVRTLLQAQNKSLPGAALRGSDGGRRTVRLEHSSFYYSWKRVSRPPSSGQLLFVGISCFFTLHQQHLLFLNLWSSEPSAAQLRTWTGHMVTWRSLHPLISWVLIHNDWWVRAGKVQREGSDIMGKISGALSYTVC